MVFVGSKYAVDVRCWKLLPLTCLSSTCSVDQVGVVLRILPETMNNFRIS